MIQLAICDDDKNDIEVTENFTKEYMEEKGWSYTIEVFRSGEELMLSDKEFDFIFLDIAMGEGMNGIVTGKQFQKLYRNTKIIYTTSFQQYCEQALNNVHAFAYLTKPIEKEKLYSQLDEVLYFMEDKVTEKQFVTFEVVEITKELKLDKIIQDFDVEDIFYFEYVNRKIKIKTEKGDFYFMGQMKKLMDKMAAYSFESCHQSYLVNLKHIRKMKGYDIYLKNGDIIPLSQKKSSEFREKLNRFIQKSI